MYSLQQKKCVMDVVCFIYNLFGLGFFVILQYARQPTRKAPDCPHHNKHSHTTEMMTVREWVTRGGHEKGDVLLRSENNHQKSNKEWDKRRRNQER